MTGTRPVIGISVGIEASPSGFGPDRLCVRRIYAEAVRDAGGMPVLLPPELDPADAVQLCDGFVVTGGADLPACFEAPGSALPKAEIAGRVAWDRALLGAARTVGRPLLGVCYGMQLLNLHAGGTLLPDIIAAIPGALDHGGAGHTTSHEIAVVPGTALFAAIGARAQVASRHHQAVDRVATGFRAVATAPDGVVEAIESTGGEALLGVEWHPESDATASGVYGWLVARASA